MVPLALGISHPAMAIIAVILFVSIVSAVSLVYIYVLNETTATPVLNVYAEAYYDNSTGSVVVVLNVKHVRGRAVELSQVNFWSEKGLVVLGKQEILSNATVTGCSSLLVLPGSTCSIALEFEAGMFLENKTYQGFVVFSEGTYPVAFTPVRRALLVPPIPLRPQLPLPPGVEPPIIYSYTFYTDFDNYFLRWINCSVVNQTCPGYTGSGLCLSEYGSGVGVYYVDWDLSRDDIYNVTSSVKFKLQNGTGYYGLIYIRTSPGEKQKCNLHDGYGVVVNISRRTLEVIKCDFTPPVWKCSVLNSSGILATFDPREWHVLVVSYALVDNDLNISASLLSMLGKAIANITHSVGNIGGQPIRYAGFVLNEVSVVVDDFVVITNLEKP